MLTIPPLADIQAQAARDYVLTGLPSTKQAPWHYTPLQKFWPTPSPPKAKSSGVLALPHMAKALTALKPIVIAHTARGFRWPKKLPAGLICQPLTQAMSEDHRLAQRIMRQAKRDIGADMAGANLGQLNDGLYLRVDKGLTAPVLLHWQIKPGLAPPHHSRCVIDIDNGAAMQFLELGEQAHTHNLVLDMRLGARAHGHHLRVMQANATTLALQRVQLGAGAQFKQTVLLLGSCGVRPLLTRHASQLQLARGAEAELRGLAFGTSHDQTELHFTNQHKQPSGKSRMRSRHILWGDAISVFRGCIDIARRAIGVEAEQKCEALLCSDTSRMNAQPALRIFADDVACAHGVSIGELDAAALFYLQSRGLTLAQARALLLQAQLSDSLSLLKAPFVAVMEPLVHERLRVLDALSMRRAA